MRAEETVLKSFGYPVTFDVADMQRMAECDAFSAWNQLHFKEDLSRLESMC